MILFGTGYSSNQNWRKKTLKKSRIVRLNKKTSKMIIKMYYFVLKEMVKAPVIHVFMSN